MRSKSQHLMNEISAYVDQYYSERHTAPSVNEIAKGVGIAKTIAVVFHAAKAAVWGAFSEAIQMSGLEIQQSSFLDKTQASFKQVVSKSSVQ